MNNISGLISDPYDRKARLSPALLALLPFIFLCISLFPEIQSTWSTIWGLVVYCGSIMLLVHVGRNRGKALELSLFQEWGGKPSVAMLRHCDTRLAQAEKNRYRAFLERKVPKLKLASPEEEEKSLAQADDGYESATTWLLTHTRDPKRFRLIFQENINYGFHRNIRGLKPIAIILDIIVITILLIWCISLWTGEVLSTLNSIGIYGQITGILVIPHLLLFLFLIKRDWIRVPAEAYARQLLAACDHLDKSQSDQ